MLRVTSDKPDQFDQYTLLFSIPFMGTPLTIIAEFSLLKPRILILLSPKPPPSLVAYIPGVDFKISGNSCVPNFSSIKTGSIVDTATGVLRATAIDEVIVTSASITASGSILIVPKSTEAPFCVIFFLRSLKPTYLNTNVPP